MHYLLSDDFTAVIINDISCLKRYAAIFLRCLHFNYLETREQAMFRKKSSFFESISKRMEPPSMLLITNASDSIVIFSSLVWTSTFCFFVLEIIATENTNFRCVRRESNKKKETKLASVHINAMLRIVLMINYPRKLKNAKTDKANSFKETIIF